MLWGGRNGIWEKRITNSRVALIFRKLMQRLKYMYKGMLEKYLLAYKNFGMSIVTLT